LVGFLHAKCDAGWPVCIWKLIWAVAFFGKVVAASRLHRAIRLAWSRN
jgi:hypothetical protein